MIIIKYISPDAITKVISEPGYISLRFNLPSNYNDPYELFLAPDEPLGLVEQKAYYEFFLREIPQAPVTCFSHRPESVVMWAHYCKDAAGICLVINEDKLVNQFDMVYIHDVEYSNKPACISSDVIRYAAATQKGRHTMAVLAMANRAAYFYKRSDWSYEQERRLIVPNDSVEDVDGVFLANLSSECVSAVITGPKISEELFNTCKNWTNQSGIDLLKMHYSKRLFEPYFTSNSETLEWFGSQFKSIPNTCGSCGEPLNSEFEDLCELCQVTDADLAEAAYSNAFVLYLKYDVIKGLPFKFEGLSPKGKNFGSRDL